MLTLNSRSLAVGVMILTSWAVDALCIAFGPGAAKETLPTSTFWQTVRDYREIAAVSTLRGLEGRYGAPKRVERTMPQRM